VSGIEAIAAAGPGTSPLITSLGVAAPTGSAAGASFASILVDGMRQVDAKVANANSLVQRFAIDDTVPIHQVTYALEEARLAVELAMQVRTRLVESYRELMNMQL
jgi:flagellar hook-basal body complex protein FliE